MKFHKTLLVLSCLFLFLQIHTVLCKNILVLYVHNERSHLFSMVPFLQRLSESGHNLTIFDSGDHESPSKMPFECEVVHAYLPLTASAEEFIVSVLWRHNPHSAMMALVQQNGDVDFGRLIDMAADKLTQVMNRDYDLVIVDEIFSVHGMAIALIQKQLGNVPYLVFTTSNVGPDANMADFAMAHHPVIGALHGSSLPSGPHDVYDPSKFSYRLYNVLQSLADVTAFWFILPKLVGYQAPPRFSSVAFDTSKLMANAELHLRESFDRIGRIVPHANDFRSVGSHCKTPPDLGGELKSFVEDSASKGTIYLAFGSILNFDKCPEFVFDALFNALNMFPEYRIIMSMKPLKNRTLPQMNDNIRLQSWTPQYAILGHPKTKVFMSHGGLKSFKEALCSKTPALFLPVFAEQGVNARVSIQLGIGSALSKYTLTKDQIVREFNRLLTDASFVNNMDKIHAINLDRPMPSLDEGVWMVNKMFRRVDKLGFAVGRLPDDERTILFFRRKGVLMSFVDYFNLDLFVLTFSLIWVLSK